MLLLTNRAKIVSSSYHTQWICHGIVGGRWRSSRLHSRSCWTTELYASRCHIVGGRLASNRSLLTSGLRRRAGPSCRRRRVPADQVLVGVRSHTGRRQRGATSIECRRPDGKRLSAKRWVSMQRQSRLITNHESQLPKYGAPFRLTFCSLKLSLHLGIVWRPTTFSQPILPPIAPIP